MRHFFSLLLCLVPVLLNAQLNLFEQQYVNTIHMQLPADTLADMYANLNKNYHHADFVYTNAIDADTLQNVGFKLRGNTSLMAQKKSFKISFNEYDSLGKYKGVKKLNLIGSHNDPTMVRQKLFYDCWNKLDFPKRKVSFVHLYINQKYFGLYACIEEIDKEWLNDEFGNNNGNLYKCIWPADLLFLGTTNQSAYKSIMNGNNRAYELQTNETTDDYSDLVNFIYTANQAIDSMYLLHLDTLFDYRSYLTAYALDVATGNWDNYAYNKNNYFLYHDSLSRQFKFITYDTDNTFGVDWLGIDWTTRDFKQWYNQNESRPLIQRLLAIPQSYQLYLHELDRIVQHITNPDSIFSHIDSLHNLLLPYVPLDTFRTLDYGYTVQDFSDGFTTTVDNHTPYGIKPFLLKRKQYTQVFLNLMQMSTSGQLQLYPNPTNATIQFSGWDEAETRCLVFNTMGQCVFDHVMKGNFTIDCRQWPKGEYVVQLRSKQKQKSGRFLLN